MIVAVAQLTSRQNVEQNLDTCRSLISQAHARGADWILFPENTPFLGAELEKLAIAQDLHGEILASFASMAREYEMWITVGSFAEISPEPNKTYNTQVMFSPDGAQHCIYRKIHLFDAVLPNGQKLQESAAITRGDIVKNTSITHNHDTWNIGLSICYDLRFPELYRTLRAQGAHVLTVPSAFTVPTGHAHWHTLLRARAVENQCYVLAPNQWGQHSKTRASFGQSAIYDPWGRQLATAADTECIITAELDMNLLESVRARMPVFEHALLLS